MGRAGFLAMIPRKDPPRLDRKRDETLEEGVKEILR